MTRSTWSYINNQLLQHFNQDYGLAQIYLWNFFKEGLLTCKNMIKKITKKEYLIRFFCNNNNKRKLQLLTVEIKNDVEFKSAINKEKN